jgi:superfamily II DNA or RNA helicase
MAKKIPWAWQKEAVARFAKEKIAAIVAACGTGKTLAACLLAKEKNLPVIIIAPGHLLCSQWKEDIEEALGEDADVWVYNKPEETKQGDFYRERFAEWVKA